MTPPHVDQLVLAYRSSSSVEVRALAAHLDETEIETRIIGDFLDGAGLDVGGMSMKELWVARSDWPQVEPMVRAWRLAHHPEDVATPSAPSSSWETWGWLALVCLGLIALGRTMGVARFQTLFTIVVIVGVLLGSIVAGVMKLRRRAAEQHDDLAPAGQDF